MFFVSGSGTEAGRFKSQSQIRTKVFWVFNLYCTRNSGLTYNMHLLKFCFDSCAFRPNVRSRTIRNEIFSIKWAKLSVKNS
jgi:hypothetical protein